MTAPGPPAPLVLVIEDEAALAEAVRYNLEREGFRTAVAGHGAEGLRMVADASPDLVILDPMLPGMSGLDVCRLIRASSAVPILILTAKDGEADKVAGLEVGADDYVTKPFSVRELVARVRAQTRRSSMAQVAQPRERLAGGPVVSTLKPTRCGSGGAMCG